MAKGRPKGAEESRRRVVQSFYDKHWNKLSQYRHTWVRMLGKPETRTNPQFKIDYDECLRPPSLSFSEILRRTKLSEATISYRLREMIVEGVLTKRRQGKYQIYTVSHPHWQEWLRKESTPRTIVRLPRGRPRKPPYFKEDVELIERFRHLSRSEIEFLTSKGVIYKEHMIEGQVVGGPFMHYGPPTDSLVRDAITKLNAERKWEEFVKREKKKVGLM